VLIKDTRYALRGLLKRPGFTAVVVITLALGIGTNTAIFSVVNAVLLRPLPYPESDRIVMIWGKLEMRDLAKLSVSPEEFVEYSDRNHSFSAIAAYAFGGRDVTGAGESERIETTRVTDQFFSLLGTQPLRGRTFSTEENQPGRQQVAVISYDLWQRRFAGDDNVLGQNLVLDGVNHTVIGVMPADFQFPSPEIKIWTPIASAANDVTDTSSRYLNVIARTKPGVELPQAQAEIAAIAAQMEKEHPDRYEPGSGWGASVVQAREEMVGDYRVVLLILLGLVSFVLLIACLNVANLMLARAASRRHEVAVRAALGAGRFRLIRQSLVESLLLSMTGGVLGLLVGSLAGGLIRLFNPASLPRAGEIQLDVSVLIFTFAISLVTGLIFGVVPAVQASRLDLCAASSMSLSPAPRTCRAWNQSRSSIRCL
jgi:putative ABC transport system permease protein